MRLTNVMLASPPKFKFWVDWGAGKQRRYHFHKLWRIQWRFRIPKMEIKDHRLQQEDLPAGSTIVQAKSLIDIPVTDAPKILYNHPWPYQDPVDMTRERTAYSYTWNSRFFVPQTDCANLTNTIITTDQESLFKHQPLHFTLESLDSDVVEAARRRFDWATKDDFTLIALPRARQFPRLDQKPMRKYGTPNCRATHNVLSTMNDFTAALLASKFAETDDFKSLSTISALSTIPYPKSVTALERDGRLINFDCEIDFATLGASKLPNPNLKPETTTAMDLPSMGPRSWRSLLEQKSHYTDNWRFALPSNKHVQTIMISPRVVRPLAEYEMLDRMSVASYVSAIQAARLDHSRKSDMDYDPLTNPVNHQDILESPVTIQCIGYDSNLKKFHFGRFQLNSAKPSSPVKNQLWYSGPVEDFETSLSHWLSFQQYGVDVHSGRVQSQAMAQH